MLQQYSATIRERSMIADKITLDQRSIPQDLATIIDTTQTQIQHYQQQQQSYMQTIAHFEQNSNKIQEKIQQTQEHIQTARVQQQNIQQQIIEANIPDPTTLKEQIAQHTQQQVAIQSSINTDNYRAINITLSLDVADHTQSIVYAHHVIQGAIQQ